ncbi:MAG: hypothetical protein Kow0031_10910 [Anaerolineae bacterium]
MDSKKHTTQIATVVDIALKLVRPLVAHKSLAALGLALAAGASERAAYSALLYSAAVAQQGAAPGDDATKTVTRDLPAPLAGQVRDTLAELLAMKEMSASAQVLHMGRTEIGSSATVAAAALLLVDVSSFVTEAKQIGIVSAGRYVLQPGSAVTFRPRVNDAQTPSEVIQLYDGLARQIIKSRQPTAAPLGEQALTLLYSLEDPTLALLKEWYQDKNRPIYILEPDNRPGDEGQPEEVEAEAAAVAA